MSASGPKRTSPVAPHMSAFGSKADMAFCGISLPIPKFMIILTKLDRTERVRMALTEFRVRCIQSVKALLKK